MAFRTPNAPQQLIPLPHTTAHSHTQILKALHIHIRHRYNSIALPKPGTWRLTLLYRSIHDPFHQAQTFASLLPLRYQILPIVITRLLQ